MCVYVSVYGNTDCVLHFYSTMVIFPTHFIISYFFLKRRKITMLYLSNPNAKCTSAMKISA